MPTGCHASVQTAAGLCLKEEGICIMHPQTHLDVPPTGSEHHRLCSKKSRSEGKVAGSYHGGHPSMNPFALS